MAPKKNAGKAAHNYKAMNSAGIQNEVDNPNGVPSKSDSKVKSLKDKIFTPIKDKLGKVFHSSSSDLHKPSFSGFDNKLSKS